MSKFSECDISECDHRQEAVHQVAQHYHWCALCGALRLAGEQQWAVPAYTTLGAGYKRQLDAVAETLVRAKVLTAEEIARQGLRFAVRDKYEPTHRQYVKSLPV